MGKLRVEEVPYPKSQRQRVSKPGLELSAHCCHSPALNIALNSRRLNLSYLSEALSLGMGTLCMHVLPWAVEVHSFFGFHCWVPGHGKLKCQDEKLGLILTEIRSLQRLRLHISRFSSIFIMNSGPLKKAMELCHSSHPYFHKHWMTPFLQAALVFHRVCPFVCIVPLHVHPPPTPGAFEVLLYYLPISLPLHPWEKLTSLLCYHKEEKMLGVGRKKTNLPPYPLHAGHCARGLHLVYCHFSNHLANRNYPHMWYETLRWCHVSRVIEPNVPVGFKIKTWFHLTPELMFL